MPLQMHRQQDVLHDVLGLIGRLPGPRQTAARRGPEHRRDGLEQAMIRRTVPGNGRPHQAGPFVLTFAHARSHNAIRSIIQFVTLESADHEVVIEPWRHRDRRIPAGNGDDEMYSGRLIASFGPADTRRPDSRTISRTDGSGLRARPTALPCFRPDSPEDSLFLPRCGHARSSPCVLGAGNMGRLPMTIKASGRSALIIAAGIWACFAGALHAAEGA